MKRFRSVLGRLLKGRRPLAGGLRGRIHKISYVKGGELSIVIRFGIEEAYENRIQQGTLVAMIELDEKDAT